MSGPTPFGKLLTLISAGLIAVITLSPGSEPIVHPIPAFCIACGLYGGIDFSLNVLLFVPFGLGIYLTIRRFPAALLVVVCSTLAIELLQVGVVPHRDASASDVLANSIGGAIGAVLGISWRLWLLPGPYKALLLTYTGVVSWIGFIGLSSILLKPTVTPHTWWAQVKPELEGMAVFSGSVDSVQINERYIEGGRLDSAMAFKAQFGSGSFNVHAFITETTGLADGHADELADELADGLADELADGQKGSSASGKIAPITSIFDETSRQIMMLGQLGDSYVFSTRTITSSVRLREPVFRLKNSFASADTLHPSAHLNGNRDGYKVILGIDSQSEIFALHPFLFWSAIVPFQVFIDANQWVFSAVWAALIILIPAYWMGRTRGVHRTVASVLVSISLIFIPIMAGMEPIPLWGWAGTALGMISGVSLGRFSERFNRFSPDH